MTSSKIWVTEKSRNFYTVCDSGKKKSSNCSSKYLKILSSTKINHLPKLFSLISVHFLLYKNGFLFLLVDTLGLLSVDFTACGWFISRKFSSLFFCLFCYDFKRARALTLKQQVLSPLEGEKLRIGIKTGCSQTSTHVSWLDERARSKM